MRKMALAATAALALALTLTACSSAEMDAEPMSDSSMTQESSMPSDSDMSEASTEMTGDFMGFNDKAVMGSATVTDDELTLSEFSSDEGPDLHVYLTNGTDEAAVTAGTMIDTVSFDTASQTFDLSGVDASGFTHVVIHCDKAKAVFGAAELS
ncbi:MAG: DM13 domain-containing protein [Microbacterium sp.]